MDERIKKLNFKTSMGKYYFDDEKKMCNDKWGRTSIR